MESLRFWIYAIKTTKDPALYQLTQVSTKQKCESLLLETFTYTKSLYLLQPGNCSVADPWHFGVDPDPDPCPWRMDPDPAIFVIDLQDASKKLIFNKNFLAYYFLKLHLHHFYFLKLHLHHFSKIKSQKVSQKSRNQGFSYYFCMMIEGSGSRAGPDPYTYLWLVDPDGPKTCRSGGSGFGSATLPGK